MDDAPDLVGRLLLVAGMIMEDTTEAALMADPGMSLEAKIGMVANAGADIASVAAAAAAIARQYAVPRISAERRSD